MSKYPIILKTSFFLTLLSAISLSFGQKSIDTVALSDLQRHLSVIASDAMEGRETGTPGIEKAAVYLETEFKRLGLSPGNGKKIPARIPYPGRKHEGLQHRCAN